MSDTYAYYVVLKSEDGHVGVVITSPARLNTEEGLKAFLTWVQERYGLCVPLWWKRLEED